MFSLQTDYVGFAENCSIEYSNFKNKLQLKLQIYTRYKLQNNLVNILIYYLLHRRCCCALATNILMG